MFDENIKEKAVAKKKESLDDNFLLDNVLTDNERTSENQIISIKCEWTTIHT